MQDNYSFVVRTPRRAIPIYRVVFDGGAPVKLVFRNFRTGVKEIVELDEFIDYVLAGRMAGKPKMFYTRVYKIPIGRFYHDEAGRVFIEVSSSAGEDEGVSLQWYIRTLRSIEKDLEKGLGAVYAKAPRVS